MDLVAPMLAEGYLISPLIDAAADNPFWYIMGAVALTAIVVGGVKGSIQTSSRERTRREIAAYIAEGSMTPEQGERLMKAEAPSDCC